MNQNHNDKPYFFLNTANGEIILSESELPRKRSRIFKVFKREQLLFNEFAIKTRGKIKKNEILKIQESFIPFKDKFVNFIYLSRQKSEQHFFFWIKQSLPDSDHIVFDEIPESLIFKGDPAKLKEYNMFVFKRMSGFEAIYFDGVMFFSMFAKDPVQFHEKILLLALKYSRQEKIKIYSEIELNTSMLNCEVEIIENKNNFFILPSYCPLNKFYSSITQNKHYENLMTVNRLVAKFSTILLIQAFIIFLFALFTFFYLRNHQLFLTKKREEIAKLLTTSDLVELRLEKIRKKISKYPDYPGYLKIISNAIDPGTVIYECSILEERIFIKGVSNNSLLLLNKLRKNKYFETAKFKTPVTKNDILQKEEFLVEVEINSNVK